MEEEWQRKVAGAFAASLLAHVLAAVLLVALPMALPPAESAAIVEEFSIIVEEAEAPEAEPEPEIAPQPQPPEPAPETEAPTARTPRELAPDRGALLPATETTTATITPETTESPAREAEPSEEPRVEETPEQRRERLRILMDPAAVARGSSVVDFGAGPTQRRGPQTGVSIEPGPGRMTEAEAEAMHSGSMREQAMERPWLARAHLTARPRPDGTFVYSGHAFNATIHPDGSVTYDDRPGVQTDGFSTSGSFDLGDAFMRAAGGDPYAAERMRFEEDNEELIARLEAQYRREHMADALRAIPGQLAQIWNRTSRSPERRRRQIFEMWEETDEGESGLEARRRIEAWVRENLPAGGGDAFTDDELRALNATHSHPYRFNPYR